MQMLNWCNRFNICLFLDNHNYNLSHHSVECLIAAGATHTLRCEAGNAFDSLRTFSDKHNDWIFGHFGYDLKNETEQLTSANVDGIQFPDLFFFVPEIVIKLSADSVLIGSRESDAEQIWEDINSTQTTRQDKGYTKAFVRQRYTRPEYVQAVQQIRQHILRGDCYELNFCQEFFWDDANADPLSIYTALSSSSPNPFSAFYKLDDLYLACLSPERYLKKEGSTILSQPIKGTAGRNLINNTSDKINAEVLQHSEKERAENIMIVDLVRNDLSKVCVQGSVHVEELCAVYSFPQVHHMISTISGEVQQGLHWTEVIRATFPMGSMTGAPKKRVMELIEKYEKSKRGLFSGSIGYVTPERDFDFNVVIRSVLYNRGKRYLSFHAGSAITFNSDPENEYEECLLKAAAIKKALAETNTFH